MKLATSHVEAETIERPYRSRGETGIQRGVTDSLGRTRETFKIRGQLFDEMGVDRSSWHRQVPSCQVPSIQMTIEKSLNSRRQISKPDRVALGNWALGSAKMTG
jgi:hypothetical protein